jgi:hypothetical protein
MDREVSFISHISVREEPCSVLGLQVEYSAVLPRLYSVSSINYELYFTIVYDPFFSTNLTIYNLLSSSNSMTCEAGKTSLNKMKCMWVAKHSDLSALNKTGITERVNIRSSLLLVSPWLVGGSNGREWSYRTDDRVIHSTAFGTRIWHALRL